MNPEWGQQRLLAVLGHSVFVSQSLFDADIRKRPSSVGFRSRRSLVLRSRRTGWSCRESATNSSLHASLISREETGKTRELGPDRVILPSPTGRRTVVSWRDSLRVGSGNSCGLNREATTRIRDRLSVVLWGGFRSVGWTGQLIGLRQTAGPDPFLAFNWPKAGEDCPISSTGQGEAFSR